MAVCLYAYCIATAVLIVSFEVFAQQLVYTPQYISISIQLYKLYNYVSVNAI
jgi:hypothetical protein